MAALYQLLTDHPGDEVFPRVEEMKRKQEGRQAEGVGQYRVEGKEFVKLKTHEEMHVEGSAGKSNRSKWNINGIHFLAVSCRNTLEVQGEKNHFAVITVIYIREQHW